MTKNLFWICQPLRSISITETSTLLRADPPLCSASVLSPRGVSTCASPLTTERQVLMFHIKACLAFMPPICRLLFRLLCQFTSKLIPGLRSEPGFNSIGTHFDTSSGVHLRSSLQDLPDNLNCLFHNRSRQLLFTNAALGGLIPASGRRNRETYSHL